jgi:hypothetical protein
MTRQCGPVRGLQRRPWGQRGVCAADQPEGDDREISGKYASDSDPRVAGEPPAPPGPVDEHRNWIERFRHLIHERILEPIESQSPPESHKRRLQGA